MQRTARKKIVHSPPPILCKQKCFNLCIQHEFYPVSNCCVYILDSLTYKKIAPATLHIYSLYCVKEVLSSSIVMPKWPLLQCVGPGKLQDVSLGVRKHGCLSLCQAQSTLMGLLRSSPVIQQVQNKRDPCRSPWPGRYREGRCRHSPFFRALSFRCYVLLSLLSSAPPHLEKPPRYLMEIPLATPCQIVLVKRSSAD